ncbi:MAG: flagellar biosynthesis protein FlhB [Pseudomonadales bacterium]
MAEEDVAQEKTEEATPKRLQQARDEGQIARSKELNTAVLLLGASVVLVIAGAQIRDSLAAIMKANFAIPRAAIFDVTQMLSFLATSSKEVAFAVLPFLIVCLLLALAGPLLLGGWSFSTKALQPKMERISLLKGLKRMFSMQALMELAKAVAKVVLVGGVASMMLSYFNDSVFQLDGLPVNAAMASATWILSIGGVVLCAALILIAGVDVPFQLQQHKKKMRMTLQQVKDEMKETDGRPEVKGRIRQLQREFASARMMSDVPDADVVIVNPSHYSIALKYAMDESGAPKVVAKGIDHVALRIREVAKAHDVQIVEAPPLARALYHATEIGDEIPDQLFLAVAQVLAYVFQLAQGDKPPPLKEIEIPADMQFDP